MCLFVWVVGFALCDLERLCNCIRQEAGATPEHGHSHTTPHSHGDAEAHAHDAVAASASAHSHESGHHHDADNAQDDHGCKDKQGCDDQRCCSTIRAFLATPTPIVIAKPVAHPALIISLCCPAREHALGAPSTQILRQARRREWVFTPKVCLGPALHSLAPPASV